MSDILGKKLATWIGETSEVYSKALAILIRRKTVAGKRAQEKEEADYVRHLSSAEMASAVWEAMTGKPAPSGKGRPPKPTDDIPPAASPSDEAKQVEESMETSSDNVR